MSSQAEYEKVISFHALKKARSTLEDFAKTYLYYHQLEPVDFLKYMDVLIYIECIIYSIDEINEQQIEQQQQQQQEYKANDFDDCNNVDAQYLSCITTAEFDGMMAKNAAFQVLIAWLKEHEIYDDRVEQEIKDGLLYWKLERFLCNDANWKEDTAKQWIDEALIQKCISFKSFDYRLLNLALYRLRRTAYNEQHLQFLRAHELFIEIADDLFDYEDDVMKHSFNVYRMYLKLHPNDANTACLKLTQFISDTEALYKLRQKELGESLIKLHETRNKTAWKGIVESDNWIIPSAIMDEESYRKEVLQIEQTSQQK